MLLPVNRQSAGTAALLLKYVSESCTTEAEKQTSRTFTSLNTSIHFVKHVSVITNSVNLTLINILASFK